MVLTLLSHSCRHLRESTSRAAHPIPNVLTKSRFQMTIGVGVLSIPSSMHTLGGVVGGIFIVFWGLLNTCEFQPDNPHCVCLD